MPALATFKPSSVENLTRSEVFSKRPLARIASNGCIEEQGVLQSSCTLPFRLLPGECALYYTLLENGRLILLTNFRLFVSVQLRNNGFYNIPLLSIDAVECRDMFYLNVATKDGRVAKIAFENNESCLAWFKIITSATSAPSKLEDVFAFAFYAWCCDEKVAQRHGIQINGALFPDEQIDAEKIVQAEFRRLEFDTTQWRITELNKKFEFCSTYPVSWIVPACVSDTDIQSCGQYRFLRRVPAVVWRNRANGAVLVRSSQPEPGFFGWRSLTDENLLHSICTTAQLAGGQASDNRFLLILDARSYTAAWANRAKGGGFESCENYKRCEIEFLGLANIHSVRYSFQKFRLALVESTDSTWFQNLENCQWLNHVRALLNSALRVVEALHRNGQSVLVHCSDGWDRTTQIVSLAKLLLDPYYRTMTGFMELVEVEWIAFGHKFAERLGMQYGDLNQRAPVFLQWLDCIHYVMGQFPCSFEFNEVFLVKLAQHAYSGLFGTFLCNSMADRHRLNVLRRTFSVWDYLNVDNGQFRNVLFAPDSSVLYFCLRLQDMSPLWRKVYCPVEDPTSAQCKSEVGCCNSICEATATDSSLLLARSHSCDSLTSTSALAQGPSPNLCDVVAATPTASRVGGSDSNLSVHCRRPLDACCKSVAAAANPASTGFPNDDITGANGDPDVADLMKLMLSKLEVATDNQSISTSDSPTAFCDPCASSSTCRKCDTLSVNNNTDEKVEHSCTLVTSNGGGGNNNDDETALWQQNKRLALIELIDVDGLVKVRDCVQQRIQEMVISYEKKIANLQNRLNRVQRTIIAHQCGSICFERNSPTAKGGELKAAGANSATVAESSSYESRTSRSDVSWEAVEEEVDGMPTRWIPDHATRRCMDCDSEFWIINRRHHCRSCGKVFCGKCSSYECPVPEEQFYEPVRVCNSCFSTLRLQHKVHA